MGGLWDTGCAWVRSSWSASEPHRSEVALELDPEGGAHSEFRGAHFGVRRACASQECGAGEQDGGSFSGAVELDCGTWAKCCQKAVPWEKVPVALLVLVSGGRLG